MFIYINGLFRTKKIFLRPVDKDWVTEKNIYGKKVWQHSSECRAKLLLYGPIYWVCQDFLYCDNPFLLMWWDSPSPCTASQYSHPLIKCLCTVYTFFCWKKSQKSEDNFFSFFLTSCDCWVWSTGLAPVLWTNRKNIENIVICKQKFTLIVCEKKIY